MLDPGRGRTKTGRLWCYAVDNRPWRGPGHPAAAYVYSEDRKGEHPQTHLRGFRGLLQVDGYAGFGGLVTGKTDDAPQLAFCWAHVRRKFYDIHVATQVAVGRGSPAAHCRTLRPSRPRSVACMPSTADRYASNVAGRWSRRCASG